MATDREPPFRIVHEDEYLAVIDKSAELVVHPAPSHQGVTLVELLGDAPAGGDDPQRPGIVHRLDRGTSGLLVVAKDPEAHRSLQEMIRHRTFERLYLALADGRFRSRTGTIDAPIGRASRKRHRMAVSGASARAAVTHFEVRESLARDSLLEVRLETGRTHQIRVHMEAIGHPLVGDAVYGGPRRYGLERQFLHSWRLAFRHPASGETVEFEADLPGELRSALVMAREQG